METETKTTVGLRPCTHPTGKLSAWVEDETGRRVVAILSRAELQGLVQAAYDEHGMLAEPSIEVEFIRVLEDEVPA